MVQISTNTPGRSITICTAGTKQKICSTYAGHLDFDAAGGVFCKVLEVAVGVILAPGGHYLDPRLHGPDVERGSLHIS